MGGVGGITKKSGRCGTYPYSKSPDGADLNQVPPAINTMEKQADTGNNKQQHMPWSTSVGGKECSSSVLCISPLNSYMKSLCSAHTTTEETLAVGHANQSSGPI